MSFGAIKARAKPGEGFLVGASLHAGPESNKVPDG